MWWRFICLHTQFPNVFVSLTFFSSLLYFFFAPCSLYVKLPPTTIFLCLSFHNSKLIYYELTYMYITIYSSERMGFIHNKSPFTSSRFPSKLQRAKKKVVNNKILNLSRARKWKRIFNFFSNSVHSFIQLWFIFGCAEGKQNCVYVYMANDNSCHKKKHF